MNRVIPVISGPHHGEFAVMKGKTMKAAPYMPAPRVTREWRGHYVLTADQCGRPRWMWTSNY